MFIRKLSAIRTLHLCRSLCLRHLRDIVFMLSPPCPHPLCVTFICSRITLSLQISQEAIVNSSIHKIQSSKFKIQSSKIIVRICRNSEGLSFLKYLYHIYRICFEIKNHLFFVNNLTDSAVCREIMFIVFKRHSVSSCSNKTSIKP